MNGSSRRAAAAPHQRGASTAEFVIVAPVLLFLGLGAVQLGLIYHGRTILNYAAFEAARTGAVNHALPEPMRRELAVRLAPIMGGDGSAAKAAEAIARSVADLASPLGPDGKPRPATTVTLLNPTPAAFDDWGVHDPVAARTVIPNSHLRHRLAQAEPGVSGMSLRDANILEIEVVHGFELKVPVVGRVLSAAMAVVDPENAAWYAADRLPLSSIATVRMQSDAWLADDEVLATTAPDGGAGAESPASVGGEMAPDGESGEAADARGGVADEANDADGTDTPIAGDVCGEHGLGGVLLPVSESAYRENGCGIGDGAYGSGGEGGTVASDDDSSPIPSSPENC